MRPVGFLPGHANLMNAGDHRMSAFCGKRKAPVGKPQWGLSKMIQSGRERRDKGSVA
jgi:hypothetical protein